MLSTANLENLESGVIDISIRAGEKIMQIYGQDFSVQFKEDNSPLTEADRAANEIIQDGLMQLTPSIPILSEEGRDIPWSERSAWDEFWMVDPLDGTKEFVKKNGEFTVNIALIRGIVPVLGIVYSPVLDLLYVGRLEKSNRISWVRGKDGVRHDLPRFKNSDPAEKLTVLASRSHMSPQTQEFLDAQKKTCRKMEMMNVGSSLKMCYVAEGRADMYPRLGPTMEWDTAAAHAICLGAGKNLYIMDGSHVSESPVRYNKENLLNPWFIAK